MKKKIILGGLLAILVVTVVLIINGTFAVIENDSRVKENSELTYYIDVIYDGKDKDVVTSSDTATAKVNSDYIYVEDKIPEGLTFNRFITSEDGSIGAVKRSDGSSCPGYVVGDREGLVYDNTTNTVSFKVKNLQAGCKLTVGIVTTTPSLNGETRKDFYNTASARENYFNVFSNTVHVYMGDPEAVLYSVNYQYTGTVPDGAPTLPSSSNYPNGTTVGVENDVTLAGYTFSGWTTEDATVTNGKFTMPSGNVTFTGSFTSKTTNQVSYTVNGTKPNGYEAPVTKNYGAGDDVVIDTLKEGDIVDGYRFLGWTSTGLDLSEGIFTMPSSNVNLVGTFEKVTYTLTYAFQGTEMPSNADSLLPATTTHSEGDTITLANSPTASGYEFLGWYAEDKFEMPAENLTIYGEWKLKNGTFAPSIKKEIVDKKDNYHEGDTVTFKITVTNNESYAITDVLVEDTLEGVAFTSGTGYTIKSDRYAVIETIAANSNVVINATYTAGNDVLENLTNTAKIVGALASNNNELDTSRDYTSSVNFTVSNIKLNINKQNNNGDSLTGAEYTLYSDAAATNAISTSLSFTLNPNTTYYLREAKAPTGYQISTTIIPVNVSSSGVVTMTGHTVTGSNGIYSVILTDSEINILPNTGGIGTYVFIFAGLGLMVISLVGYYIYKKKRKEKK